MQNREELMAMLASLREEIEALSETHENQAKSITNFTEASAHEAIREDSTPELKELSIQGLKTSVEGFEATHPQLVSIVNRISMMLANIGI